MRGPIHSSRRRFAAYFDKRKRAAAAERVAARSKLDTDARDSVAAKPRKRSFFALFAAFWDLLRGERHRLAFALATLTVATVLGLAVPYSSKIVIDYVLTDNPGPSGLPSFVNGALGIDPADDGTRRTLLFALGGSILVVSLLAASIALSGRWQCTKLTKRTQAMLRKKAFAHAVRLPLSRISELKSGGVASILREDAGNAAELLALPDVDGGLIGGASLKAEDFWAIAEAVA